MLEPTAWVLKHWVTSIILAMGIGIIIILRGILRGDVWPWRNVISRLLSSLVGGGSLILVALGFNLNEWFTYLAAIIGGFMGMSVLELGEEIVQRKGGKL